MSELMPNLSSNGPEHKRFSAAVTQRAARRGEARRVSQRAAETNIKASEEMGQPQHLHGAATRHAAEEPAREKTHEGPKTTRHLSDARAAETLNAARGHCSASRDGLSHSPARGHGMSQKTATYCMSLQ